MSMQDSNVIPNFECDKWDGTWAITIIIIIVKTRRDEKKEPCRAVIIIIHNNSPYPM